VAKAGGGRGHRAVLGQEVREVEVGLIQLGGERSMQATVLLGRGHLGRLKRLSYPCLGGTPVMYLRQ
jgi:hypothetical protein